MLLLKFYKMPTDQLIQEFYQSQAGAFVVGSIVSSCEQRDKLYTADDQRKPSITFEVCRLQIG